MTTNDVILVGGPKDDTTLRTDGAGLLEIEIDGLIHRYIRTTAQRQRDGRTLTVYNYDGEVSPHGGESGSETAPERVASPRATGLATDLPSAEEPTSESGTGTRP